MVSSVVDRHGDGDRVRPSRRAVVKGAAWTLPTVMATAAAPALAVSPAECAPGDTFDGAAGGRVLTGEVLSLSLDEDRSGVELVTLNGVTARNSAPGGSPNNDSWTAVSDSQNNNLDVDALGLLNVNLNGATPPLANILQFAVANELGAVKQYGYVHEEGIEQGAAGYVTDDGSIRTDGAGGADGMPDYATINLREILSSSAVSSLPLVAPLVNQTTGVDALSLRVGAVAATAEQLQNCGTEMAPTLERDYLVAGLDAVISPADESVLSGLLTSISNSVVGVNVDLTSLTSALKALLASLPALGSLVGVADTKVQLTIDLSKITSEPLPDAQSTPIQVDFNGDTVTLDLAALVGGLNDLAPNAVLFRDVGTQPTVENLTGFLSDLLQQLQERLLDAVTVEVTAGVKVALVVNGTLTIRGTLRQLRDGGGTVSLLGINLAPIATGLMTAVFTAVNGTLGALFADGGAIKTLLVDVLITKIVEPVLALFYGLLHIRLNAQNRPEENSPETAAFAAPTYFDSLTWNRFDVAALHLSIIGQLSVLNLFLARAFVGPMRTR